MVILASQTSIGLNSQNLVIFDLPAIVNYDHLPLRKSLIEAIAEVMDVAPVTADIDWNNNSSGVLIDIFVATLKRFPTSEENEAIRSHFMASVKEYFLAHEDPFDVWPGIQNIFGSLDKKQNWNYFVVSDYWLECTRFILNSCGIFTRNLNLHTAEEGLSSTEIIRSLIRQRKQGESLYILARDVDFETIPAERQGWQRIKPPGKTSHSGFLEYPRFSKLFKAADKV